MIERGVASKYIFCERGVATVLVSLGKRGVASVPINPSKRGVFLLGNSGLSFYLIVAKMKSFTFCIYNFGVECSIIST